MNAIAILSAQPWVERLGWTLVHFLWQGVAIAAIYAAARRWAAHSGPNVRYLLACTALAAMLAAPVATYALIGSKDGPRVQHSSLPTATTSRPAGSTMIVAMTGLTRERGRGALAARALPWVVAVWLAGALCFWVRLTGAWLITARLRSRLAWPAPREWQDELNRLGERIRLSRPVRLLMSARVDVPTVVGWLRPVVLMPIGALAGLPAEHIEALLLHELAHIRRHDFLVNIVQSVAESLLFYHPAVWWVSAHMRAERELCCDDAAVSASGGDVYTYASALAELESSRPAHLAPALAANGGSLTERIARLLGQSGSATQSLSGPGAAAGAVLLAVTACAVFAQSSPPLKFEVASVKRNTATERRFMGLSPRPGGRLNGENAPVRMMIQNAYGLHDFQIIGGPAWIRSDGYDIEAKGDANATRAQIFQMLQSLLQDRFQLQTHRETRELPVYVLTLAKGGSKLPAPKEGGCQTMDMGAPPPPPPQPGRDPVAPCGHPIISMTPAGVRMAGGKLPISEFIRVLATVLGRPVIDKTGITAEFDLRLAFTPDETTAGLPRGMPPPGGAGDSGASTAADPGAPPNILTAMPEQLGLKLESTKGPVEVLVVDRVERPTEN